MSGSTDGLICLFDISTMVEDDSLYQVIKGDSVSKIGYFGPSNEYIYSMSHMETFSLWRFEEAEKIRTYGDVRGISEDLQLDYLINCCYEPASQRLYLIGGSQR